MQIVCYKHNFLYLHNPTIQTQNNYGLNKKYRNFQFKKTKFKYYILLQEEGSKEARKSRKKRSITACDN